MALQVHGAEVTEAQPTGVVTPGTRVRALRRALDRRAGPGDAARHRGLPADRARRARTGRGSPSSTSAGAASSPASSRRARRRSAAGHASPRSGRGSGRAATRWGTRCSAPFRERFGDDVVRGRAPRPPARRRAGPPRGRRRASRAQSAAAPRATPETFFSHRRDHGVDRTAGDRCRSRLSASATNLERIRDEVGPGVRVVVATKYVAAEELGALAEAGVETVGENRLQDLEAKHEHWGDAFRWHFIGHLQSRKAPRGLRARRARPLARLALGGAAARRARARRGEPLRRGDEVRRRAGASSTRSSPRRATPASTSAGS